MKALKFIVGLAGLASAVGFCVVIIKALELYARMHGLVQPWDTFLGLDPYLVLIIITAGTFFAVIYNYRTFLDWLAFRD